MVFVKNKPNHNRDHPWCPPTEKPEACTLIDMLLENEKIVRGWWTGAEWFHRRDPNVSIVKWRRIHGEY